MRLKSAFKDWRRRRQLRRAGIVVELPGPVFAAGARSGVWVVDPKLLGADSVVYSFGVGDNIAWDLAMIDRFGCTVHAFDPTPAAIAWVARQQLPPRFHFHRFGIGARDGPQRFLPPRRGGGFDYRPVDRTLARDPSGLVTAPVRRLPMIACELGHQHLDVVKLDIEGGEYEVIADLLAAGPPVVQLLVEFHHGQHGIPFARTAAALASLRAVGYRILHTSHRGLEFTLVRR